MYNVGDITEDGWEIISINTKPTYIKKRRVKIIANDDNYNKIGYLYQNGNDVYCVLDGENGFIRYPNLNIYKFI